MTRLFLAALLCCLAAAGAAPQRIVSTAPGITEILFALGLGDRVVGVTQYCKYPKEVTKLPKIGSWTTFNMEAILALRADLVVVQQTAVHSSDKFRAVKLNTLDVHLDRVNDIYSTIQAIGDRAEVPERARALTAKIRQGLADIRSRVSTRPRSSILFVVGHSPGSLDGLVAVGPNSYLAELIDGAGGQNVLADARVPYVKLVREELLARKPQVILDIDMSETGASKTKAEFALWKDYGTIPAVRDRRVHVVESEIFVVPGPRVVECAREIARFLHPELFR